MPDQPRHIRVFLSSPGDVPEERKIASGVLDALQYDSVLRGKVTIEVVAWDQPGSDTPLLANMTPQEAINQGMPVPADCDIVIVIFWSRMGTPLPPEYTKSNGERYLSGTEWEFVNAVEAANEAAKKGAGLARPRVVIYRRMDRINLDPDDANFEQKTEQWRRVKNFFNSFTNPDGSLRQGYNSYEAPEQFRVKFEEHIKKLVGQVIDIPGFGKAASGPPVKLWKGSPFPGLRSFTPDDEPIFYGRGAETDDLVERMRNSRFVAVVGASGSGKSSLVAAGLLPRLSSNAIDGSKDWILPSTTGEMDDRVWVGARFTPGENPNPFMPLAARMADALKRDPAELAAALEATPEKIEQILAPLFEGRPAWAELLVYIDQFEELLTLADKGKIDSFVRMLKAIHDSTRLRIILTLRADFYARCVEILALSELLKNGTFPLSAPGSAALYEMIAKPADRAGLNFEYGLVEQILKDTGADAGALALLAYLLDELYRKNTSGTETNLTFAQYNALGGVQGAIGKRAEEVVGVLPRDEQAALPRLFAEIVEVDARGRGTRRRAVMDRLADDPAISHIIEVLTAARLLVTYEDDEKRSIIEVAHEALVREWDRLATWIISAQADLLLRRQLEQAARDWSNATSDKESYGLLGDRLLEAQRWQARTALEPEVAEFIKASEGYDAERRAEENRRKQELIDAETASQHAAEKAAIQERRARQRTRIAALMGVISAVIIVAAIFAALAAAASADTALTGASTTVAGANNTLTPIPITLTAIQQTVVAGDARNEAARLVAQAQGVLSNQSADNLDAVLLAIRALNVQYSPQADAALVAALNTSYQQGKYGEKNANVLDAVFSPDGQYVLTGEDDGVARLWDRATSARLREFLPPDLYKRQATATAIAATATAYHGGGGGPGPDPMLGIRAVAFSPNEQQVVGVDKNGHLLLWDVASGQQIIPCADGQQTSPCADGQDTAPFDYLRLSTFSGFLISPKQVIFSPDGRYLLSGDDDNRARLWDVATGKLVRTFSDGQYGAILNIAFTHDGRQVMTSSDDQTTEWWDVATGASQRTYTNLNPYYDPANEVTAVGMSPDDNYLLLGKRNGDAQLLDIKSGQTIGALNQHTGSINKITFSRDSRYILTASSDKTAILWDIITTRPLGGSLLTGGFLGAAGAVTSAVISPDSRYVLTTSDPGNPPPNSSKPPVSAARLYGSGLGAAANTYTGNIDVNASGSDYIVSAVFSPDKRYVLTADNYNNYVTSKLRGTLVIHDINGAVHKIIPTALYLYSAVFSPDGRYIAAGGYPDTIANSSAYAGDSSLQIWETATGKVVRSFSTYEPKDWKTNGPLTIRTVAFSPDGRYLLTGADDGTARVWDITTGKNIRTFTIAQNTYDRNTGIGDQTFVTSAAFSPDGRYVVTGSHKESVDANGVYTTVSPAIEIWDVNTETRLRSFQLNDDSGQPVKAADGFPLFNIVNSVAFSPDGHYVLSGSNGTVLPTGDRVANVLLWDVATGAEVRDFSGTRVGGHTDAVTSVAFSPDGRFVLTGSNDNTAKLWDLASGTLQRTIAGHIYGVASVAFSPDGAFFLTGSNDGTARLWDTDYRNLVHFACTQVWRDFTADERTQFGIKDQAPTCSKFAPQDHLLAAGAPTDAQSLALTTSSISLTTYVAPGSTFALTLLPTLTYPGVVLTFTPSPTATSSLTATDGPAPTDTPIPPTKSETPTVTSTMTPTGPTPTYMIVGTHPNWTPLPLYTPSEVPAPTDTPSITVTPSPTVTPSATIYTATPTATIQILGTLPNWTPLPAVTISRLMNNATPANTIVPSVSPTQPTPVITINPPSLPDWTPIASATALPLTATNIPSDTATSAVTSTATPTTTLTR